MEVCGKRAEGLDGAHGARRYVFTLEKLLEAASDALLSGLGEKGEQGAFALEKPAEGLGDREHRWRTSGDPAPGPSDRGPFGDGAGDVLHHPHRHQGSEGSGDLDAFYTVAVASSPVSSSN